jgi:LysR family hydrogen peroxide-inducible transcriptional activator
MDLQQIRYFLALCEEGTFTRAAERCGVSQPSLSNAIKQLEVELGGPLFERSRKVSRLTDLGRCVLPHLVDAERSVTVAKSMAAELLIGPAALTSNEQEKSIAKSFMARPSRPQ